jgi:hypothetical protein
MEEAELRRLARKTGFDLAALEKDYALTWLLNGIYSKESKLRDVLIFKGGTAIRKVYFPEWRLSEDLDFTILQRITPQNVKQNFQSIFGLLAKNSDVTYSFGSFKHSAYAILADIQFLGPLRFKNRIAHDISLKEKLIEEPEWRAVGPFYDVPVFKVLVYSLNEILIEKIRSIFQRGKARDYYDVWRLFSGSSFNTAKIKKLLIRKCEITGIEFKPELVFDHKRVSEARKFWTIALSRLTKDLQDFDTVMKDLKLRLEFLQK